MYKIFFKASVKEKFKRLCFFRQILSLFDRTLQVYQMSCSICHEEINESTGKIVTSCKHEFHISCMTRWMVKPEATCPECRSAPGPKEIYKHEEDQEEEVRSQERCVVKDIIFPNPLTSLSRALQDDEDDESFDGNAAARESSQRMLANLTAKRAELNQLIVDLEEWDITTRESRLATLRSKIAEIDREIEEWTLNE
jgi:hypothetical protein